MNLANKSFRDNRTGEVVKVIDSFENIAVLENRTKVDTRRLMDANYYTEYIDPGQFLDTTTNSAYNSIFETIKSIPADKIPIEDGETPITNFQNDVYRPIEEGPAIVQSSVDDEKAELARKYGTSINSTSQVNKQNEAFAKILGEESRNELPFVEEKVEAVQKVDIMRDDRGDVLSSEYNTPVAVTRQETKVEVKDPYEMFRGIKRTVEFKLDLPLMNSIPKIQFIEMMEESYDKSIIEFLAHDITEEILKDPDSLRRSIESKIREMVYGPEEIEVSVKKPAPKRAPKPNTAVGEKPGSKPARASRSKKQAQEND
jgi:hypothetical protein